MTNETSAAAMPPSGPGPLAPRLLTLRLERDIGPDYSHDGAHDHCDYCHGKTPARWLADGFGQPALAICEACDHLCGPRRVVSNAVADAEQRS